MSPKRVQKETTLWRLRATPTVAPFLTVAKLNSQDTKRNKQEGAIAVCGRARDNKQWVWIWKERDNVQFYLPFMTRHYRGLGELILVRILTFCWLLTVFPRSKLWHEWVEFKLDNIAQVSTRSWQGFPWTLILVFPWLFKGITGSSLLECPSESHHTWDRPTLGYFIEGRYGDVSKVTNLADFCLQSCSLFRVERQFRWRMSRVRTQVKEDGGEVGVLAVSSSLF